MEGIFTFLSKDGKLCVTNPEDLRTYCYENDEQELIGEFKPVAKTSPKLRMYAFYHKVILHCAVIGYTYRGWSGIDKVKADYLLRAEFAKDYIQKPDGEYQVIMMDKRGMTKVRLHKYMSDCIFFIEEDLQQRVPDSEAYKLSRDTGRNFTKIN